MSHRRSPKKKNVRKNNKLSQRFSAAASPLLNTHLGIEPLEDRRMLANNVTAALVGGALAIGFTATDTAVLTINAGNVIVTDQGTAAQVFSGATGTVNSITVTGGTGTDNLTISSAFTFGNLASVTESSLAGVSLGASVTTTGIQTYNDPVTLTAGVILTSSSAGTLTLGNTVNGGQTLSVDTAGTAIFGNVVGGTAPLTSLTVPAGGTAIDLNGGGITTTGAQTYDDAVVLGAGSTLTSTGSGAITLGSTVNGAFSLSVSTAGNAIFDSTVGVASLTTSAASTAEIGGNVTTTNAAGAGNQTYNGAVQLLGAAPIQFLANGSTATTVTFGSSLSEGVSATAVPTVTGAGSAGAVSLAINALSSAVTITPTTIHVLSSAPAEPTVDYASLAGGISISNTSTSTVTVDGAVAGSNTLSLSRPSAGTDSYTLNSGPAVTFPSGAAFAFVTTGDGNNNTLDIVRGGSGDPVSAAGATFTGGLGTGNTLNISGGTVTNLIYNATAAGAGNVSLDGAKTTFTGLQPVTVTSTPTNVTINVTDAVSHKIALGAVTPTPVAGESEVSIDGGFEEMTFTNPTASLSLTGTGHADTITLNPLGSGFNAPTIGITDGSGAETDILATPTTSTGTITTVSTNVATLTAPFTVYVGTTSTALNNGTGSLANLSATGTVTFADLATSGSGQLYVDDSGNTSARIFGVTNATITPTGAGTINYSGVQTNVIQVAGGTGGNTFNVTSTSGNTGATTTVFGGFGTGTKINTYNVTGSALGASTVLNGEGIASTYNVNLAATLSIPVTANLTITGHDSVGFMGTSSNRDTLALNALGGSRTVGFNYQSGSTASSIQVTGLGGSAPIAATNVQQVDYQNGGANSDNLSVTGPTTASDITVAPQSQNSALVFLGATGTGAGAGWAGPPAVYATTLPGIAGGSLAPDLDLSGAAATGLTINGGATDNDQLTVYAPGETQVLDSSITAGSATPNPFGFGTGVIVPGHTVGSVYNTINVSDSAVTIPNDSSLGPLLTVKIASPAPFVQTVTPTLIPGLIVDSGDQAGSQVGGLTPGVADNITATFSTNFKIQVNGQLPSAIAGSTNGDELTLATPADEPINVWNDASNPPNVTINTPTTPDGIGYSSIENLSLAPGNHVLNVYGNNNLPNNPQNDYVNVVGTGPHAFQLQVGTSTLPFPTNTPPLASPPTSLSAPITVTSVNTLNVYGGPDNPNNTAPPTYPDTDINALNITPWANNTPLGWGIQTYYNQGGATDGDLLIWNGLSGVSENITVQPSGPLAGQVYATNPAAGNSSVAIVNYTGNLGIVVNGSDGTAGEVDTLTLDGTSPANGLTSGTDTFDADFGGAGDAADPYVAVSDSGSIGQPALYSLLTMSNINTITMDGLGGGDTFNIESFFATGGPKIFLDGGATGSSAAVVDISDSAAQGTETYTPGDSSDSGTIAQYPGAPAAFVNTITFRRTQVVNIDGDGSAAETSLIVNGIGNGDTFLAEPLDSEDPSSGTVQVDNFPPINFTDYGNGAATVTLNAVGNNANFNITPISGIATISAEGDVHQPQSSSATINGDVGTNTVSVSPTGITSGTVTVTGLSTVDLDAVDTLLYNGQGFNDALAVVPPAGSNAATYTPGNAPDAGSFQIGNLLGFSYTNLGLAGSVTYGLAGNTDTLGIQGTAGNDVFSLTESSGTITLNQQLPLTTTGVTTLSLNGNGGVDTFNVTGTAPLGSQYTGGILINAAGAAGDDPLNVTGTPGNNTIGVDLLPTAFPLPTSTTLLQTISGLGGVIGIQGVGTVNINGGGGTDTLTVTGNTANSTLNYTPTGPAPTTTAATTAPEGTFQDSGAYTIFNFADIGAAFTGLGGSFTVNGTSGANSVTVDATTNNDTVVVNANNVAQTNLPARSVSVFNALIAPTSLEQVTLGTTVQSLTVQGGLGSNSFLVVPDASDSVLVSPTFVLPTNLLVNIVGGPIGAANDSLVVGNYTPGAGGVLGTASALTTTNFAVVDRTTTTSGVVRVFSSNGAANQPNQFPDIDYSNVAIVQPDVATSGLNSQDLVLGPDANQPNNSLNTATYLGTGSTINANNLTIFPTVAANTFLQADQSYFRVVAQQTGTLDFQMYFTHQSGFLPNGGQLQMLVYDQNGNLISGFGGPNIANSNPSAPTNFVSGNGQRVLIPVVAGETYYLRVFGIANNLTPDIINPASPSLTINGYNLSIINTPAAVPYNLEINSVVAQGTVNAGATATSFSATSLAAPTVPLSSIDNFYTGQYVTFVDTTDPGTLGQTALVTNYVGATRTFTLAAPVATTPGIGLSAAPTTGAQFQIESSDTGRSQFDDTTRDTTPTIYLNLPGSTIVAGAAYLQDLTGGGGGTGSFAPAPINTQILIPFNTSTSATPNGAGYRVAIFDNSNSQGPVLVGYAQPVLTEPGVYSFTFPLASALSNGLQNITSEVQIISPTKAAIPTTTINTGFGGVSAALNLVVDDESPLVYFGSPSNGFDGLAAQDQGSAPGETNVTTPTLYGTAEADAIIKLYAVVTNPTLIASGVTSVLLGQTVATPTDGTNQDPTGGWTLTSTVSLNNPTYFSTLNGNRTLYVTATDVAGNISVVGTDQTLPLLLVTTGPQIVSITAGFNGTAYPSFPLFSPKPEAPSPTPLTNQLNITVTDFLPAGTIAQGTVNAGATTTTLSGTSLGSPVTPLSNVNGFYDGQYLTLYNDPTDPENNETAKVTGYVGATNTFTLAPVGGGLGFTTAPLAGDTFEVEAVGPPGYLALLAKTAQDAANYSLVGKSLGPITIETATITSIGLDSMGNPTATVTLTFTAPLRNDVYTLTVSDALTDNMGNALLGDVTQTNPDGSPIFPTGVAAPPSTLLAAPSNFVGTFMVDTDANVGTYADASANLDLVGYGPTPFTLAITGNLADSFGIHDGLLEGNFMDPVTGIANGFDKLAAYGFDSNLNSFRWLINTDGTNTIGAVAPNGISSTGGIFSVQPSNAQINGLPIAGNFDGVSTDGDQLGLFTGTQFILNLTPTGTPTGDVVNPALGSADVEVVNTQLRGTPIVGDFLGNGIPDLATYLNGVFGINFGTQPGGPGTPIHYSGNIDATVSFAFPGEAAIPVSGDVYGEGIDSLGLWVPSALGNQSTGGQFYFLSAIDPTTYIPGTGIPASQLGSHTFTPAPLGNDLYIQYGTNAALPLVGIWDPPISAAAGGSVGAAATNLGIVQGPLVTSSQTLNTQSWLSITPARSGNLEVSVGAANGGAVEASLYDSNYNLLATGTVDGNGNLTFAPTATAGHTYLIRLSGLTSGTTGSVSVSNVVPEIQRLNVTQQGNSVTPSDALAIINYLNLHGSTTLNLSPANMSGSGLIDLDANMDGAITPADALAVIDYLNLHPASPAVTPQAIAPQVTSPADSVTPQVAVALDASSGTSATTPAVTAPAVASPTASPTSPPAVVSPAVVSPAVTASTGTTIPASVVDAALVAAFQQSTPSSTTISTLTTTSTQTVTTTSGTSTDETTNSNGAAVDAALGASSDWLN